MSGPIYTSDSNIFLLYAGVKAEARKRVLELSASMGNRYKNTIPIDTDIIPEGVESVDDVLRSIGTPKDLSFSTFEHGIDFATLVFHQKVTNQPKLSWEERTRLTRLSLQTFAQYYGEPTRYGPERLIYEIIVGKRETTDIFFNGKTSQQTTPIKRVLNLVIV